MEKELNIAAILKDKPVGLKFYSPTFGRITFNGVHKGKVYFFSDDTNAHSVKQNGKMYDGGECIIFPSNEMRDWSKFAWKKGDVLVSEDGTAHIIFEKFTDDTYTTFIGKYHYANNNYYVSECDSAITDLYTLETENSAQTYINTIEERLGGKLNIVTLEIEKAQPEFKDGDIVCISGMGYLAYGVVKSIDNSSKKLEYYVLNDMSTLKFEDWLSFEDKQIHPITETQQIILFDALAKKGKAWDSEKKQIVDLKPKCEFKPFDKVLGRNEKDDVWEAELFSHYKEESQYPFRCIGFSRKYCIPYNEETAHLLGTTDEWKGGKG